MKWVKKTEDTEMSANEEDGDLQNSWASHKIATDQDGVNFKQEGALESRCMLVVTRARAEMSIYGHAFMSPPRSFASNVACCAGVSFCAGEKKKFFNILSDILKFKNLEASRRL
jgi:hypothetical protein